MTTCENCGHDRTVNPLTGDQENTADFTPVDHTLGDLLNEALKRTRERMAETMGNTPPTPDDTPFDIADGVFGIRYNHISDRIEIKVTRDDIKVMRKFFKDNPDTDVAILEMHHYTARTAFGV